MNRGYRIRLATAKFNKSVSHQSGLSADVPSLILTNPAFYKTLSDYIIHHRMATWHTESNTQQETRDYFKNIYLPFMLAEAKRLKLSEFKTAELKRLSAALMNKIISDVEHNTTWATTYLVHLYQDSNIFDYITHEDATVKMQELHHQVFRAQQRKQDQELIRQGQKISFWQEIIKQELADSQQEFKLFTKNQEKFFNYMPKYCSTKQSFHYFAKFLTIFIIMLSILYLLGQINSFGDFSLIKIGIVLVMIPLYLSLEKLLDIGIFVRTPFCFTDMKETLKAGLLSEIAETLALIKSPPSPQPEVKVLPIVALQSTGTTSHPMVIDQPRKKSI